MIEYKVTINEYGTIRWHNVDGQYHREDGPAVETANGDKEWYRNDKAHREDGPAIERADGTKAWYLNDKLHREDGPAIEYANDDKEWYLNDEKLTEEEFLARTPKRPKEIVVDGVVYRRAE